MIKAVGRMGYSQAETDARFYDLYSRDAPLVLRYLRSQVRDVAKAEDLCGDAFCRAWDAWPRFRGTDREARAWLMRIARNLVIDSVRRDGRMKFTLLTELTPATPTGGADADLLDLRNAMGLLKRADRDILAMRVAGLSHAEIGSVMQRSEGSVKKAWQRALLDLRRRLEVSE
jgi:RNA polymerase sigma-70 factor (ECF subfamily)